MEVSHDKQTELDVNATFKDLIRPLSFSELNQLEESIKKDGCISPIVIWGSRNMIIDGHNRYDICKRNNIEYKTTAIEFSSDIDAIMWVIKNQFSRRNLSNYERSVLALKLDDLVKANAKEVQLSKLKQYTVSQNSDEREKKEEINTNTELSKLAGVSHDTIARVRKIEGMADEKTKEQLRKNEVSINEIYKRLLKNQAKTQQSTNSDKGKTVVKDESKKADVLYADFFAIDNTPGFDLDFILKQDSYLFLWCKLDRLVDTIKFLNKHHFYNFECLIWDKDDKKSKPELLLLSERGFRPDHRIRFNVKTIHKVKVKNKDKKPAYYEKLIKKHCTNLKVKTILSIIF